MKTNNNTPPAAPKGYKWVDRGYGWRGSNVMYTCTSVLYTRWSGYDYLAKKWDVSNITQVNNASGYKEFLYFELVKDDKVPSFIIREWKDWYEDVVNRVIEARNHADITVMDLIDAPSLDPDNPKPFCERFQFDNVYESNVFVKHHKEPNSYWYIGGLEVVSTIYHPKMG